MKEIKLTQGKVALVDDEDFDWLNQWKWYAQKSRYTYYAARYNKKKYILMHRLIMNTPSNMEVDHQDHNGLNCQKSNMRICTHSQNLKNHSKKNQSKYSGVYYNTLRLCYQSSIYVNGKQIYLGYSETEKGAAILYDIAARKYFGEFANPNFKCYDDVEKLINNPMI